MSYNGIKINPANKGKFTESANRAGMSVQEFASHVLANKEDYSSTQVKRANFARNAAKWQHEDGGEIYNQNYNTMKNGGSTYQNGVWFENGGGYYHPQFQGDVYPSTYGPVMLEDQDYNYNKLGYTGVSIVDMLNQAGLPSSLSARKKMAQAIGMRGYTGKANENQYLMQAIQQQPEIALVASKVQSKSVGSKSETAKKPTKAQIAKQIAEEVVQTPYPGVVSDQVDPAMFFQMAQQAYLNQNPGFVPLVNRQSYYSQALPFMNNPGYVAPDDSEYDDAYMLSQIEREKNNGNLNAWGTRIGDQYTNPMGTYNRQRFSDLENDIAMDAATAPLQFLGVKGAGAIKQTMANNKTLLPWIKKYGLMEAMRMAKNNRKLLGSGAAEQILRGFDKGGQVMDVTPEELEMLRSQGYNVEIL
jgi:hypothetical protein